MVYSFSRQNWADEIAAVTEESTYQTCEVVVTHSGSVLEAYDYTSGESFTVDKGLEETARTGTDSDLITALSAPPSSMVFRTFYHVEPAAQPGDIWVWVLEGVYLVFQYETSWVPAPVFTTVYAGQARFIPVRAGVWQGGESQANATSLRAVRFQFPFAECPERVFAGSIVTITSAPDNPSLVGRTAKVNDDFQGSTSASRTISATMDADSEDT